MFYSKCPICNNETIGRHMASQYMAVDCTVYIDYKYGFSMRPYVPHMFQQLFEYLDDEKRYIFTGIYFHYNNILYKYDIETNQSVISSDIFGANKIASHSGYSSYTVENFIKDVDDNIIFL